MTIYEEGNNWLEEEINKQKSNVKEPNEQDRIGKNRDSIGNKLKEIGFVYNRHVNQKIGSYSYEQYQLLIKNYNMKIICAIGSKSIYVAGKDLKTNEYYYLFEYETKGTYLFASDPDKFIEEFKFLLKHSFLQCLYKIGKEEDLSYYKLYNLEYDMEKQNTNTILNVFLEK